MAGAWPSLQAAMTMSGAAVNARRSDAGWVPSEVASTGDGSRAGRVECWVWRCVLSSAVRCLPSEWTQNRGSAASVSAVSRSRVASACISWQRGPGAAPPASMSAVSREPRAIEAVSAARTPCRTRPRSAVCRRGSARRAATAAGLHRASRARMRCDLGASRSSRSTPSAARTGAPRRAAAR